MSELSPPPLAEQVAALAAELRLAAAGRAEEFGAIAAIQALILATLARLFTTLAGMVTLWQAGLLPPPASRRLAPRRPGTTPRPHAPALRLAAHHPRARRQRHPTEPECPTTPEPAPESAPLARPTLNAALARVAQRQPHPTLARAPPWPSRSNRLLAAPPPHAHSITISYQIPPKPDSPSAIPA